MPTEHLTKEESERRWREMLFPQHFPENHIDEYIDYDALERRANIPKNKKTKVEKKPRKLGNIMKARSDLVKKGSKDIVDTEMVIRKGLDAKTKRALMKSIEQETKRALKGSGLKNKRVLKDADSSSDESGDDEVSMYYEDSLMGKEDRDVGTKKRGRPKGKGISSSKSAPIAPELPKRDIQGEIEDRLEKIFILESKSSKYYRQLESLKQLLYKLDTEFREVNNRRGSQKELQDIYDKIKKTDKKIDDINEKINKRKENVKELEESNLMTMEDIDVGKGLKRGRGRPKKGSGDLIHIDIDSHNAKGKKASAKVGEGFFDNIGNAFKTTWNQKPRSKTEADMSSFVNNQMIAKVPQFMPILKKPIEKYVEERNKVEGRGFKKGSKEAKEHMAKIRAMRKK